MHLINHKAHAARIYPPALVAAILRGLREQLRSTGEMMEFNYPVPDDPVIPRDIPQEAEEELESYWDDANWVWLDPKLVRAARAEELAQSKVTKCTLNVRSRNAWKLQARNQCPYDGLTLTKGTTRTPSIAAGSSPTI